MKNLSKRTKALLAIAGIVIVVVVVGLVIVQPGQDDLVGTTVIHISPENPTIAVGQSIDLSINSVSNCKWSSSVPGIVTILNYNSSGDKNITVQGAQPGTTTIKADCIVIRYTTVTVAPPPVISPANPVVGVGQTVTLSTGDATCQWALSSGTPKLSLSLSSGASTVVTGLAAGTQTISARCAFGTASATVTVSALSITPANPTVDRYGNVTLTIQGPSGTSCTWASSALSPRILSSTATSAIVYGTAPASATITATCNTGTASTLVSYDYLTLAITPDRPATCPLYAVKLTAQKTGAALSCTWSTSDSKYVDLYDSTATTTMAEGKALGGAQVTATCNGETASMNVSVENLSRCSGILR